MPDSNFDERFAHPDLHVLVTPDSSPLFWVLYNFNVFLLSSRPIFVYSKIAWAVFIAPSSITTYLGLFSLLRTDSLDSTATRLYTS